MNNNNSNQNNNGSANNQNKKALLAINTVIKNKWKIVSKLGQGSFGEIYSAVDLQTGEETAIKVEKSDNKKMVLKLEVIALKKLQSCQYVVRYIHSGRHEDFNFLVMERLGENLADLKKKIPSGIFSLCTTTKLGIQMIESLEGVHKLGYIHRDVKPSNFVMGRTKATKDRCYLIDFGLARKYRLPSGDIRPPRKNAGFRGTARYASISSHHSKDLGRRDDLWSVFYVLVEFALGSLPWRKVRDKEHIGQLKERYTTPELVKDLPGEFLQFMEHLQKLGFSDEPDYDFLRTILFKIYSREGYPPDAPFDWEMKQNKPIPKKETPSIVGDPVASGKEKASNASLPARNNEQNEYYNIFHDPLEGKNDNNGAAEKKKNKKGCCVVM